MAGYHPYVFDVDKRRFVGKFEEMYQAEDRDGFDSWHERDLRPLRKRLALEVLAGYNFSSILEIGSGKGTFTHLLKKNNNRVVGVDLSPTAVAKARHSFSGIEFRAMTAMEALARDERFDLVVIMGTFAYIENWRDCLAAAAGKAAHCLVAEYIPPNPIGFVKSPAELIGAFQRHFVLETKLLLDDEHVLLLGASKEKAGGD